MTVTFSIAGFEGCPDFQKAKAAAAGLSALAGDQKFIVDLKEFHTRDEFMQWLDSQAAEITKLAAKNVHKTSPLVCMKEENEGLLEPKWSFVGGWPALSDLIAKRFTKAAAETPEGTATRSASSIHLNAAEGSTGQQPPSCLRIFIAGDRSQVGKSSVCLGVLSGLLTYGYKPEEIAYIKPATQCERVQLVSKYCESAGIKQVGIGPVVFYSGFTREFLKGNTATTAELLSDIRKACDDLAQGRKVLVVDGVGYPAVGSICGVSNAETAKAARAKVLLVCPPGVGNAVDSFNLNATYFESRGVEVLGAIFNKCGTEGFYSRDRCEEHVNLYFSRFKPYQRPFGFLPLLDTLKKLEAPPPPASTDASIVACLRREPVRPLSSEEAHVVTEIEAAFERYVDMVELLKRLAAATTGQQVQDASPPTPEFEGEYAKEVSDVIERRLRKTREEIMAEAQAQGASAACFRR